MRAAGAASVLGYFVAADLVVAAVGFITVVVVAVPFIAGAMLAAELLLLRLQTLSILLLRLLPMLRVDPGGSGWGCFEQVETEEL